MPADACGDATGLERVLRVAFPNWALLAPHTCKLPGLG
jgi:hypothetical protein